MCHCSNEGVEWAPNKSQHTKLTLEKKFFPPLLPKFKLTTFQSQVWPSYQQAILAEKVKKSAKHKQKNFTTDPQQAQRVETACKKPRWWPRQVVPCSVQLKVWLGLAQHAQLHHFLAGEGNWHHHQWHFLQGRNWAYVSCPPFLCSETTCVVCQIWSWSENHLARHSERGKKTRQTGRGGKPTSGNGQAWSQKKRWKDNIRKLTGKEFAMSQRAVKNRSKWRKLVAKLYVVPLRPSLLRDRSDDGRLLPWGRLYIFCRVRESKPRRQRGGILRKPIYVPCTTQYTFFFFF